MVRGDGRSRSVLLKTAAGGERELAREQVLVAAGRRPVSAGLNLSAVGVRTGSRGEIVTDAMQRTGNPRIWAAGDATGGPPYAYTAAAQGSVAAANALFHSEREVDYTGLPRVTFTSPAIASAGLTEAELVRSGVAYDCRVLPLKAVPRAIVNRDTRGVVKLVVEAVHALCGWAVTPKMWTCRVRTSMTNSNTYRRMKEIAGQQGVRLDAQECPPGDIHVPRAGLAAGRAGSGAPSLR